jgi:hypothetical protein
VYQTAGTVALSWRQDSALVGAAFAGGASTFFTAAGRGLFRTGLEACPHGSATGFGVGWASDLRHSASSTFAAAADTAGSVDRICARNTRRASALTSHSTACSASQYARFHSRACSFIHRRHVATLTPSSRDTVAHPFPRARRSASRSSRVRVGLQM